LQTVITLKLCTFWTLFDGCKTTVWALMETLGIITRNPGINNKNSLFNLIQRGRQAH